MKSILLFLALIATLAFQASAQNNAENPGIPTESSKLSGHPGNEAGTNATADKNHSLLISLLVFDAFRVEEAVHLRWTSSFEAAIEGFGLERSGDGRDFSTLDWLPASNTAAVNSYNQPDNNPLAGANYYRLRMTGKDGSLVYSRIVKVDVSYGKSITTYPNPVNTNVIWLQMYGQVKGNFTINLYNAHGEMVMSTLLNHDGMNAVRSLELNKNVTNGYYTMEIIDPEKHRETRAVLVRQ